MKQWFEQNLNSRGYVKNLIRILIAAAVFFFLFRMLSDTAWRGYRIAHYEGTYGHRESSWTLRAGEEILEPEVKLPRFMHLKKGMHYSISAPITYDGSADNSPYAFFYIHHMFCRAYLDGEQIFSYMPEDVEKRDTAKSPGNVYVALPMPADCLGKTFSIAFIPPLDADIEYELPNVLFGDYPTVAYHTFLRDLPHNIVAMVAGFLGIASILFSTLAFSGTDYREGLFIGIFALLFSVYNLTECNFNFYLISNPYYTYLLNYTAFSLIPVFLMAFLRERLTGWQKKICSFMVAIGLLLTVLEGVLHFSGIMDMREFLPYLHIGYFTELITVFFLLISMGRSRMKNMLILQLLPIIIGTLLDAAVYYRHWSLSSSDAAFTSLGVVIFLIIELYHVWQSSLEIYTESIRSHEYHVMAYVDTLTGIGNRRAYDAERARILSGEKTYQSLFVVSVDVNDLKIVNDTLGHAAGDFLIRNAATVMSDLCENCGQAYRTGGDEFVSFLYDISQEEFDRRVNYCAQQIRKINSNSEAKLSLALGYEQIRDNSIDAAMKSADKKMYRDKADMKAAAALKTNGST